MWRLRYAIALACLWVLHKIKAPLPIILIDASNMLRDESTFVKTVQ